MQGDHLKKLLALPSEWWRLSAVSSKLSEWFSQYIIGLAINAEYSGHYVHRVLSGFLVSFDNLLLWFTAGHVIDQLKNDLSCSDVRINRMRWLDRFAIKGAESIPITGIEAFSSKEIGIPQLDFGVIRISGLEEKNLRKNSRVKVFTPQAWYNAENSNPEGFYLLGFPKESLLISDELKEQPAMWINLVTLPIQRIKPGSSAEGEFWEDKDAFYGQILSFIDNNPYSQINDIDFMSGGPIISIERDAKHGFKYRLFAIQRGWLQKRRIIRAEPFNRIMPVF